jgi:hydroxypyruvate isomerase
MERRNFLKNGLLSGAATLVGASAFSSAAITHQSNQHQFRKTAEPFRMKFSPEFGIFDEIAGKDPVDQIKWGYDQGFRAWENTGLARKSVEEQERISKAMQKLGMEFGQFVGTMSFNKVTFAGRDASIREKVLQDVQASVEIAKRMNTKFVHNVLGQADPKLPEDFQMANAIDLLRRIAEIYEPQGIIMLMETMNRKKNHSGMFLHTIPQAYALAKAVASPSLKLLYDFYHVQIEEGNLLPTLDYAYDEIAYFQLGDTPGRHEPTTGEINFPRVLQHLQDKGYRGFVGMEHGNSLPGKEGELATLSAYRFVDPK